MTVTHQDLQQARKEKGKELKLMRVAADYTIQKLAEISGLSAATISKIENGKCGWTFDTEIIYRASLKN